MKWALLFCILFVGQNSHPGIQDPEIIKTFVSQGRCIKYMKKEADRINGIRSKMTNPPDAYLGCVKYTGPWKIEARLR